MSIKRYDGSNFFDVSTIKRFDGANWIDVNSNKRFDGTNWIETLEQQLVIKRVAFNGSAVEDWGNASLNDTVSADGKTYSFTSFGQQGASRYIWLQAMGVTVKTGDTITFTNLEYDMTNGSYLRAKTSPNTIYSTTKEIYIGNGTTTITANADGNLYVVFYTGSGYTYSACEYLRISTIKVNSKTYKDIIFSK